MVVFRVESVFEGFSDRTATVLDFFTINVDDTNLNAK